MNSTKKILSINNLSKTFYSLTDEIKVIDNLSFDIYENDFIGIIGPSGCGKSSILNIISELDKEYKGSIEKNNLKIGYMFQEDTLFDWLTVYENILLVLKITKTNTEENKEYVNNLLKKYKLYDFINKYPSELSGGMKQRLSLIRTLAYKPNLLLLVTEDNSVQLLPIKELELTNSNTLLSKENVPSIPDTLFSLLDLLKVIYIDTSSPLFPAPLPVGFNDIALTLLNPNRKTNNVNINNLNFFILISSSIQLISRFHYIL